MKPVERAISILFFCVWVLAICSFMVSSEVEELKTQVIYLNVKIENLEKHNGRK